MVQDPHELIRSMRYREVLLTGSALKLGIFEAFQEDELSANDVARRLDLDLRATEIVLKALQALDYLAMGEKGYRLTEKAKILTIGYALPGWMTLPETLKTGQPSPFRPAMGSDRYREYFIRSQRKRGKKEAPDIVRMILGQAPEAKTVLDVGGGPGAHAEEFAAHGRQVTVLDLPDVIELMREKLEEWGIVMVTGDFNQGLPPGPFDLAFLSNICHVYGPKQNRTLFKRAFEVLSPGGWIVIQDMIRGRDEPHASVFAVHMLLMTETGNTYTEAEYRGWLAETGFQNVEVMDVPDPGGQLIMGKKNGNVGSRGRAGDKVSRLIYRG
ncbi:MAG: methyltransferase [Candidatus Bipolaricaulia bacterium]